MPQVLLTNALQRKTLAALRSLGARQIPAITSEVSRFTPATFSKYCCGHLVYPNPQKSPSVYRDWLINALQKYNCDVLFPMDDDTLEVAVNFRNQLEPLCHIPIPPSESYYIACDKAKSVQLAQKAGIDCPYTVCPTSNKEVECLASNIAYPAVIKPRKSSGSRGIRLVHSGESLVSTYTAVHNLYPYPIIQEYIGTGERFDVCLLYNKHHKLRASFVQKEIRHFPPDMGPSTVQESIWFPELIEKARSIIEQLDWYGIVELEFMRDSRDGKYKFMEINPRFWGSLQMSITAGVDFPWLLYKMLMDGDVNEVFEYKTGLKCQWLLPGDLLHFICSENRFKMDPPLFSLSKSDIYDDIISRNDPLPTLGFLMAGLRNVFSIDMWKMMFFR